MGIPITPRKRKLLSIATGAVLLVFVVLLSSSKSHQSNNIAIADNINTNNPLLSDDLTVQVPGENSKSTSANRAGDNLSGSSSSSSKNGGIVDSSLFSSQASKLDTKKLTNANNFVKGKEGVIDESKVKLADSSDNIPLVAGDPTSKKAHDKSSSSSSNNKNELNNDLSHDTIPTGDSSLSSNGIKADKGLGSNKQKESLKNSNDDNVASNLKNKPQPAEHKNANSQIMDAQKKAQEEGVSKDEGSSFNPKNAYEQILSKSPVVIFSKSYCPFSKKLKNLLKTEYNITPEPVIIELDDHENGKELQNHVGKETGRFTVPNFIVKGTSRGGADDIVALHDNDELVDLFHNWAGGAAKIERVGGDSPAVPVGAGSAGSS